jgi:hypothetical protein
MSPLITGMHDLLVTEMSCPGRHFDDIHAEGVPYGTKAGSGRYQAVDFRAYSSRLYKRPYNAWIFLSFI